MCYILQKERKRLIEVTNTDFLSDYEDVYVCVRKDYENLYHYILKDIKKEEKLKKRREIVIKDEPIEVDTKVKSEASTRKYLGSNTSERLQIHLENKMSSDYAR